MQNYLEFIVSNSAPTKIFDSLNSSHLPLEAVLNDAESGVIYVGGSDVSADNYNFGPIDPKTIINIAHTPEEDVYVIGSEAGMPVQTYYPVEFL